MGLSAPNPQETIRRAEALAEQGRLDEAIAGLKAEIGLGAFHGSSLALVGLQLAKLLLQGGRPKASVAQTVKVLRIDPRHPEALLTLAEALIGCQELERARDILDRARRAGQSPGAIDALMSRIEADDATEVDAETPSALFDEPETLRASSEELDEDDLLFDDDEFTSIWERDGSESESSAAEVRLRSDEFVLQSMDIEILPGRGDLADTQESEELSRSAEGDATVDREPSRVAVWTVGDPGRSTPGGALAPAPEPESLTGSFPEMSLAPDDSSEQTVDSERPRDPASATFEAPSPLSVKPGSTRPPSTLNPTVKRNVAALVSELRAPDDASITIERDLPQDIVDFATGVTVDRRDLMPGGEAALLANLGKKQAGKPVAGLRFAKPPTGEMTTPARPSGRDKVSGVSDKLARTRSLKGDLPAAAPSKHEPPPRTRSIKGDLPYVAPPTPLGLMDMPLQRVPSPAPVPSSPPSFVSPPDPLAPFMPTPHGYDAKPEVPRGYGPRSQAHGSPVSPMPPAANSLPPERARHRPAMPPPAAPAPLAEPVPQAPRPVVPENNGPPKPHVSTAARQSGKFRARKPAAVHIELDMPVAVPAAAPPPRNAPTLLLVGAVIVLSFVGIIGLSLLVLYPMVHYRMVQGTLEPCIATAKSLQAKDTYIGYKRAAQVYRDGLDETNPEPWRSTSWVDGYLVAMGFDDHERLRLGAQASLAEVEALLMWRYHDKIGSPAPKRVAALKKAGVVSPRLASASALIALAHHDPEKALAVLGKGLKRSPRDADLHYLVALTYALLGQSDKTYAHLRRALTLDSGHVGAHHALGQYYARRGDRAALKEFDTILDTLSKKHPGAAIDRARFLIDGDRDLDKVGDDLERLFGDEGKDIGKTDLARSHLAFGLYKLKAGQPAKAEAHFKKAMELAPDLPEAVVSLVELLLSLKRLDEAAEQLKSAEDTLTAPVMARLRGQLLLRQNRPEEARLALASTLPDDAVALTLKGHSLLELGRNAEARAAFDAALHVDPRLAKGEVGRYRDLLLALDGREDALRHLVARARDSSDAADHWRLGVALAKRDPQHALESLAEARKIDPNGSFRFGFPPAGTECQVELSRGNLKQAAARCRAALKINKGYVPAQVTLAAIALRRGHYPSATKKLKRILSGRPSNQRARILMTRAQIELGQVERARKGIDALLSANAPNIDTYTLQGLLNFKQRRYDTALGWFQRAHHAEASDAEVSFYIAWSLLHLGRVKAARDPIRTILEDPVWGGPAHTAAAEYRRRLRDWNIAIYNAEEGVKRVDASDTSHERLAEAITVLGLSQAGRWGYDNPLAVASFRRAASLDSLYAPAMLQWALVALRAGDDRAYANRIQRAVTRDQFYCPAVTRLREWKAKNRGAKVKVPDTCTSKER